jgi:hypothetical protein
MMLMTKRSNRENSWWWNLSMMIKWNKFPVSCLVAPSLLVSIFHLHSTLTQNSTSSSLTCAIVGFLIFPQCQLLSQNRRLPILQKFNQTLQVKWYAFPLLQLSTINLANLRNEMQYSNVNLRNETRNEEGSAKQLDKYYYYYLKLAENQPVGFNIATRNFYVFTQK